MNTYSLVSDVRREFKSVLDKGTVITDDKIIEFNIQNFALINAYIGTRYQVPVTGTAAVNQKDTVTFTGTAGAETRSLRISGAGQLYKYEHTTTGAETATQVRDAVLAKINGDKDAIIVAESSGADQLIIESKVLGYAYGVIVDGSTVTFVNNVVAVFGSSALRLLRKIETELSACKIANILKVKVAEQLQASGVRQDVKDESCGKLAMSVLKDIQDGKVLLEDATLAVTGGGLGSSDYAGTFQKDVKQW